MYLTTNKRSFDKKSYEICKLIRKTMNYKANSKIMSKVNSEIWNIVRNKLSNNLPTISKDIHDEFR